VHCELHHRRQVCVVARGRQENGQEAQEDAQSEADGAERTTFLVERVVRVGGHARRVAVKCGYGLCSTTSEWPNHGDVIMCYSVLCSRTILVHCLILM